MSTESKKDTIPKKVLGVGLEAPVSKYLREIMGDVELVEIARDGVLDIIDKPLKFSPLLVLCGPLLKNTTPPECAQILRSLFSKVPVYFLSEKRRNYENDTFLKNGFADTFVLVLDGERIRRGVLGALSNQLRGLSYRSVRLTDIESTTVVDFDVALLLPKNEKYITFTKAGDEIGVERYKTLKTGKVNSVHIPIDQMSLFHKYTAKTLAKLAGPSSSSNATENVEKMQNAVRSLFSNVLGNSEKAGRFESAKEILEDCKEIVRHFVANSSSSGIMNHIRAITGETFDSYSHGSNTAVFATLIGMGLGLPSSEELSIAGFLHDIGMAEVPLAIQKKSEAERTQAEAAIYRGHVDESIKIIKAGKVILKERVLKAISQHHEAYNGSGYPKGLIGNRISIEAQVLRIADYIDENTSVEAGRRRVPLEDLLDSLKASLSRDTSQLWFDPDLMKRVLDLFFESHSSGS